MSAVGPRNQFPEVVVEKKVRGGASRAFSLAKKGVQVLKVRGRRRAQNLAASTSLEASRVDWLNCTAAVMGKGRKERSVPFSAKTGQALLEYAQARSKAKVRDGQFFLGKAASIEGVRMSPHTLRHTFAVLYIRNGGDSFSLQEILGHSTLGMTKRYVNLASRDVAEQHKKFSPMEGLMGKKPDTLFGRAGEAVRLNYSRAGIFGLRLVFGLVLARNVFVFLVGNLIEVFGEPSPENTPTNPAKVLVHMRLEPDFLPAFRAPVLPIGAQNVFHDD